MKHPNLMYLQASQKEVERLKAKLRRVEGKADTELTLLRGQQAEAIAARQVSCFPWQADRGQHSP